MFVENWPTFSRLCHHAGRRNLIQRTDNFGIAGTSDRGPMAETMIKAGFTRKVIAGRGIFRLTNRSTGAAAAFLSIHFGKAAAQSTHSLGGE
jgi:hypothetical protein